MHRGVVVAAMALTLLVACTDDNAPASRSSSGAVSSGSDAALARSMARTLADGIQQGANGQVTSAQADCLADQVTAHIRTDALSSIASTSPDPKSLPKDVRQSFAEAFDACLSADVANQLKQKFGL
jgi:hypothetical protein